jgi:hypothetical protein
VGKGRYGDASVNEREQWLFGRGSFLQPENPILGGTSCCILILSPRKEGYAGLTTLPFVGGCPPSSPHSSLGRTCPSGCQPSPQSYLSGRALLAPRRSPGAAAAPEGAPPGRCAGAAGCRAGCLGQAASRSPPTAGARAGLGPWWARACWAQSGPRSSLWPAPKTGWRWWLLSGEGTWRHQDPRACRPSSQSRGPGLRNPQRARRASDGDPGPSYIWVAGRGRGLGVLWGLGGAGMAGGLRLLSRSSWRGWRRGKGQGRRAPAAALAAQATIIQLQLPGRQGRRKDLWRRLSKPKGFLFSLGSLGSVVFPGPGSPASGAGEGVWGALCRG